MYDLVVIGGGPGGYSAALECRKLGKKVLLIEGEELGGVCLNRGCIPTKSLIYGAKLYKKASYGKELGIDIEGLSYNYHEASKWKENSVNRIRESLTSLLTTKGVTILKGEGRIIDKHTVVVHKEIYKTEHILIATGSSPALLSVPGIDSPWVITSREILELKERPNTLIIVGGGVIGVEFASFFSTIGTKVILIEYETSLLPKMESRLSKILEKSMSIDIHLGSNVTSIHKNTLIFEKSGQEFTVEGDYILIATGRKPNANQFKGLGIVEDGAIKVDKHMRTSMDNIYAVGDVTGRTFLAHGSVKMAEVAVKNIFVEPVVINFNHIPSVVYSDPEIASIGLTVKEAKKRGIPIIKSNIHLNSNGKYLVEGGFPQGLCMVLAGKESRTILGVHIIGSGVSEIISTATMAITHGYSVHRFREIVFPHPTLSEIIPQSMDSI